MEESINEMKSRGVNVIQSGNRPGVKWAYLNTEKETGIIFERLEKKQASLREATTCDQPPEGQKSRLRWSWFSSRRTISSSSFRAPRSRGHSSRFDSIACIPFVCGFIDAFRTSCFPLTSETLVKWLCQSVFLLEVLQSVVDDDWMSNRQMLRRDSAIHAI
jgi:hypothetical protein